MKYMMIVKTAERSGYPPKELMDAINKLGEEAVFTEAKEIVGGYAQFELKSKQEAVEGAVRFMELHKKYWPGWEGETEIRQMIGPEDFGHKDFGCPKP